MKKDVIIIGAGAAGMMCAMEAGKRGRSVLLLDHAAKLAEKIRISGGGRCNFTNRSVRPENYLSQNPHFCRSALARYTPQDFIGLLDKHGIGYHEHKHGQLFCNDSARQIIGMLKKECDDAGVEWRMPCRINRVEKHEDFTVVTDLGTFTSSSLVIATGGLSIPKIGASPFGYRIAEQFGIAVTHLRAGLVPLTFLPEDLAHFQDLSGISVDAAVGCNKARFRESLLITHRGLSGPAILQISSYWKHGDALHIDLLPDMDAKQWLFENRHGNILLVNLLSQRLPKRFAQAWLEAFTSIKPIHHYSDTELSYIAAKLKDWPIIPSGTLGYNKAEVTLGGIDTHELSSKTMESKKIPGLFFIGEVADVTGQLGGFNFQWAWSSGYVAGQFV